MRVVSLFLVSATLILFTSGCQVIKPYQRIYLNDPEMQMGSDMATKLEEKTQDIREGAYPAGTTAKAGGCGCN